MNQILTGLALFFGEMLIIGVEMWAAKLFKPAEPWAVILPAITLSIVGVCLLVYGYTFGYQAFKNIWIVTGISIASILVVEPLVAWLLFREMPTTGAFIALVLGVIGIITSIVVK
jgi:drug/metabolite transporter (DMT)-like permease